MRTIINKTAPLSVKNVAALLFLALAACIGGAAAAHPVPSSAGEKGGGMGAYSSMHTFKSPFMLVFLLHSAQKVQPTNKE